MPIHHPQRITGSSYFEAQHFCFTTRASYQIRNSPFENCDRQLDAAKNHYRKSIVAAFVPKSFANRSNIIENAAHMKAKILARLI